MSGIYPVEVEVAATERVARWRPLVNWLLALPFLLWLYLVSCGALVVVTTAWFAVVFTGRMPGSWGDYVTGVLRYGWRVVAYLFGLTDRVPGFRLVGGYVDPGDHPAVFYSAQPLDRDRLAVLFRLALIVPALLFFFPVAVALLFLLVAAWGSVLLLGRWPVVLRRTVVGCFRWWLRLASYGWLIVDAFPPVDLDVEPSTAESTPPVGRIQPDPREVTGPPWPRLIGSHTYKPPGLPRWPIGVALGFYAFFLVAAVSAVLAGRSTGPADPSATPVSATLAVPTSTAAPLSPAAGSSSSSAGLAIIRRLEARVLAAPAGYSAAPGLLFPDGLISTAEFDHVIGAGSAADLGFLGGYEATYDRDGEASFLDIQLLRFSSSANAEAFETIGSALTPDESPVPSAFPAIPGAIAANGTKTSASSCCDHEVAATKGTVAMLVDDADQSAGAMPADVVALVEQQYNRL